MRRGIRVSSKYLKFYLKKRFNMKLENLYLLNYRNYSNLEIKFSNDLNLIYGNNGSGKSNLIEAIYLLALTKSFRTNNDKNLIKKKCDSSTVKGKIVKDNDYTNYQIEISDVGKKVYIDSDKVAKISDYISLINIIIFNPLDTKIINDSPSVRRKMLDIEISQINKEYLLLLNSYNKILKNRNAFLKQLYINGNASNEYLDILTKKFIDLGLEINKIREEYLNNINEQIGNIYKNIFEYGDLKIKYKSSFSNKNVDNLLELFKKNYRKEMELGKTLFGIHHDDIEFILDKNDIREYGSVGQQKNAIISFKLAEVLIIKKIKNNYPILILDDLFSELDNNKINNIISMLNKEVQTFITTTDIDKIDKKLLEESAIFYVNNGTVERNDKNEK